MKDRSFISVVCAVAVNITVTKPNLQKHRGSKERNGHKMKYADVKYRRGMICVCFSLILSLLFAMPYKCVGEKSEQKKIALTFDDGPNHGTSDKVLDILKKYGVKATFFVVGKNVCKYPDIILREISEGHEIGNHTFSHLKLKSANSKLLTYEIDKTNAVLRMVANYSTKLFRPPEGCCEKYVQSVASNKGYTLVMWNIDTRDWNGTDSKRMVKTVIDKASDGSIILCHDCILGKENNTPEMLDVIIPKLLSMDYTFVTVSELIAD